MTNQEPLSALADVTYQEAAECLTNVLVHGGEDGQCTECAFHEFCSGAFAYLAEDNG